MTDSPDWRHFAKIEAKLTANDNAFPDNLTRNNPNRRAEREQLHDKRRRFTATVVDAAFGI